MSFSTDVKEELEKKNKQLKTLDGDRLLVRKSFVKNGTITNPKLNYHLEIICDSKEKADNICKILNENEIPSKIIFRTKKYVVYIESGDSISKFLAFIGANKSMLKFEEVRVFKEVRNNVNRKVNSETSNINKIANSSVKQIEDINLLKSKKKFDSLTEKEKEIANLRLKNPEASLQELGKMVKPEISKSGVNHRIQDIHSKAEKLRGN